MQKHVTEQCTTRTRPYDARLIASWSPPHMTLDGCRKLRAFRGQGSFRAYVRSVAKNLMRDFRTARLGKWRPCTYAQRHGAVGLFLDRAINRDRTPESSAVEAAARRFDMSRREVYGIVAHLPRRVRRYEVGLDGIDLPPDERRADSEVLRAESASAFARLTAALQRCLSALDPEEREVLRLRFWSGMTVAAIARERGLKQASLYGRINRSLAKLRDALVESGIGADAFRLTGEAGG